MTKESLPTPIPGRRGAAEYQDLSRQLRRDRISLTRALEDRDTTSVVRRSYADLDRALDRAAAYVARRVRAPHLTSNMPVPPHLDNAAARAWHGELRRLRDLRERLRFRALDDPRGRMPATVRVATRAATGPSCQGFGSRSTARACRPVTEWASTWRLRLTVSRQQAGPHRRPPGASGRPGDQPRALSAKGDSDARSRPPYTGRRAVAAARSGWP
jgi:hypothetical protein